jgi:uncharacterized membrane protein
MPAPSPLPRRTDVFVVAALALTYALAYGTACLVKYQNFLYCDFDLAIFAQATDGILRGTLFSSIRGMPWLGDHASLILFLVAPLYALHRDPTTLLILQTLALATGAFAVHRLALAAIGRRLDAIVFAALYLLYPALGYTNVFEFHPETLATAPLLFAFAFAREGRPRATLIAVGIALLAREDVALAVLGLAGYLALARSPGWRSLALKLCAAAALSLIVSFAVLRPMFNAGGAEYGRVYAQWGDTTGAALVTMLTHPHKALAFLVWVPGDPAHTVAKLQFWLHLLLPLAFLPLLAPATLVAALPVLLEHLLAWRPAQHTIVYQYTALLTPVFMVAAVNGCARLRARGRRAIGAALLVAVSCAGVSQVLFGPLFGRGVWQSLKSFEATWPTPAQRQRAAALADLARRVPPEGGVVAGFELLSRFVRRDQLHSMHHVLLGRYTFSTRPYPVPRDIVALIGDTSDRTLLGALNAGSGQRMQALCALNDLHPAFARGEALLWTRGARDTVELRTPGRPAITREPPVLLDQSLALIGWDPLPEAARAGETLTLRLGWKRVAPMRRLFPIRLELLDREGASICTQLHSLGYSMWPAHEWPADSSRIETVRIELPDWLPAATDTVTLGLQAAGAERLVTDPANPGGDGRVRLGVLRVLGREARATRAGS